MVRQNSRNISGDRPDESWLLDPKTLSLVKSQVDDADLVRMRRGQFVRTAITVFCRKGYHSSTVKEIANEAGVSAGLIYQYVSDKEDILFLALQLITHTLKQGLPEAILSASNPVRKFAACFETYCRVIDANRDACILTYRETKSLTREHRGAIKGMELETNGLIAGTVRECVNRGYFREINVELFVYHVIMVAHTWALKYWRLSQMTTVEEYIGANMNFLLESVLTRKGKNALGAMMRDRSERQLSVEAQKVR
jgi:AcrR family transcriptional regulator